MEPKDKNNNPSKMHTIKLRELFLGYLQEMFNDMKRKVLDSRLKQPQDLHDVKVLNHLKEKYEILMDLKPYSYLGHLNEFLILKEYDEYERTNDLFNEIKEQYGDGISRIFSFYPYLFYEEEGIFHMKVLHIKTGARKYVRVIKSERRVIEKDTYFLEDPVDRKILKTLALEFARMPEAAKNYFKKIGVWRCINDERKLVLCRYKGSGEMDESSKKIISKWEMIRIVFDLEGNLDLANEIIRDILTQSEAHVRGVSMEIHRGNNYRGRNSIDKSKANEDKGNDFELSL